MLIISKYLLSEKELILSINNTKVDYPRNETAISLFEKQVEINPNKVAIVNENEQVTYLELNNKANEIANYLNEFGVKCGDTVGIMQDKSISLIATILGILKVETIYVPMDINATDISKKHIISTAEIRVIISDKNDFEMEI